MPRPPRNPTNTGQMWPASAAMPAEAATPAESLNSSARPTASAALPMSNASTRMPAGVPTRRITFVMPVLPLPCSRMSIRFVNRPTSTPNGNEPRM